jgi:predicted transcriptional regulator of viral defense system
MKAEDLVKRLEELDMPVFTTRDAASIMNKGRPYTKVFLGQLVRRGAIEKVERGRYCLNGTSPYVIASRITDRSYIALKSAARFHNITTQLPKSIIVFSTKYHRRLRIKGGYTAEFVKVDKKIMYGFREYNGAYVSDIEKIFVDDVYYHRRFFYDEELETAVSRGMLDRARLLKYAGMLQNPKTATRLRKALAEFDAKRKEGHTYAH